MDFLFPSACFIRKRQFESREKNEKRKVKNTKRNDSFLVENCRFCLSMGYKKDVSLTRAANYQKRKESERELRPDSVWCERWDLNPYGITTRPSNVRVCRFRHARILNCCRFRNVDYYSKHMCFCQDIFKKILTQCNMFFFCRRHKLRNKPVPQTEAAVRKEIKRRYHDFLYVFCHKMVIPERELPQGFIEIRVPNATRAIFDCRGSLP